MASSGFTRRANVPISRRVRTRKPKLASGERIVIDVNGPGTAGLGSATGVVTTSATTEALPKRAARSMLTFIIVGLAMTFLTYVALATTVFVVMRAESHNVAVLRNTFPVGAAPADTYVYASSAAIDTSLLGKVEQAVLGVPAGSVVRIVAGPAATVWSEKNGKIVVDGTATDYVGKVDRQDLTRQYLAMCVAGACENGSAVVIAQDSIVGEAKGYLGLDGISPPTIPTVNAHP